MEFHLLHDGAMKSSHSSLHDGEASYGHKEEGLAQMNTAVLAFTTEMSGEQFLTSNLVITNTNGLDHQRI